MTEPDEAALLKGTLFELPRRGGKSLVLENLRQAAKIKALERLLGHFLETFCDLTWDPEKEPEVIEARALLKEKHDD